MTVHFNIEATEWTFEQKMPFDIATIKDEVRDFELPLYDKDDNETERITLPNCRVIELIGDEESFLVIMENAIIKEENIYDVEDDTRVFNFVFDVEKGLWQQGEDIGVFYTWENLPEELKEIKLGK